jgi:hypothetical protein
MALTTATNSMKLSPPEPSESTSRISRPTSASLTTSPACPHTQSDLGRLRLRGPMQPRSRAAAQSCGGARLRLTPHSLPPSGPPGRMEYSLAGAQVPNAHTRHTP